MFLASIGRRCLSLSFFIFIGLLSMFGTRKWFSVLMSFLSYLQAYLREYDRNDILLKAGFYPCTSICFIMLHYQSIDVHYKCRLYVNQLIRICARLQAKYKIKLFILSHNPNREKYKSQYVETTEDFFIKHIINAKARRAMRFYYA